MDLKFSLAQDISKADDDKTETFQFNLEQLFKKCPNFLVFVDNSLSLSQVSFAEKQIAFIDIDLIMNQSEFGKRSYKKIDDDFIRENEKLLKIEKFSVKRARNSKTKKCFIRRTIK